MSSGNGAASAAGRLVAVAQARSSGVTTTALALGLCWPRPALLAELDAAGGVLAARFGLSPNPGLLSLAAAGVGGTDAVSAHLQALGPLPALLGPLGPEAAGAALSHVLPGLSDLLGTVDEDVIADCGRLGPGVGQAAAVLSAASLVVLVARPSADGVADLRLRLAAFPDAVTSRTVVVLVGSEPYPPGEVAAVLDVEVAGVVAWDPAGAGLLGSGVTGGMRLGRSALWRSVRELPDALVSRLDESTATSPAGLGRRLAMWRP